jgi:hypothetical protein
MTASEWKVLQDRWAAIQALHLKPGNHEELDRQYCVMEATAYVAGEPWSDHPQCACPVITSFMISWNDGLPTNADRDRLLKPFIPRLVGSRSTDAVAERRSYLALDWLVRVYTPQWLDLVPTLREHAAQLRGLEQITDLAGSIAARAAVRVAAGEAAWEAAGAAAGEAAWEAAWEAAGAAAWEAAGAAAGAAAWEALSPTVEWLQTSALDLLDRMLAIQSELS